MKKQTRSWIITLAALFAVTFSYGQSVESLLGKALSLSNSNGSQKEIASLLGQSTSLLNKELNSSGGEMKGKLLSQVGQIENMIPLASQGKLNGNALSKVINTVRTLLAANRISNMLKGGKSGLLSNASALTSNLDLLKSGAAVLGGNSGKVNSLISAATKGIGKFDKKGFLGIGGGELAAKTTSKKLSSLVSLVGKSL